MAKKVFLLAFTALCFSLVFSPAASEAAERRILIKVNAPNNPKAHGTMPQVILYQEFKKQMEERFPGRVEVRLYWDRQLAPAYDASTNALQNNVIHLEFYPLTTMAEFSKAGVPFSNLFLVPYPHTQIIYDAFDGEVGEMIRERTIKDARIRPIAYWEVGFRHMMNNGAPLHNLDQLRGLKFRVQPNPVHLASFKALGTNPTPITWGELFTALQQGVVDGTENPFENIVTARLYEVQKYLTLTGHAFEMGVLAMGEEFYQSLPEDIRTGMNEIMTELTARHRVMMAEKDKELLEFFRTSFTEVNELSVEELARFREAVRPVRQLSIDEAGEEYSNRFFELMEKYEADYFARTPQ